MISIKEKIQSKPSVALQFMLDGLIKQSERADFKVDMRYFGALFEGVCCGCAATCAIQELTGINFDSKTIKSVDTRAEAISISESELLLFESAINEVREGCIILLFEFCNLDSSDYKPIFELCITTCNWENQLPRVKELIEDLELHGF
jgi:hypothetical protein